ncbi:hypothetical protein V1511DRAFT_95052 [Dipodascopsis uninucleata]
MNETIGEGSDNTDGECSSQRKRIRQPSKKIIKRRRQVTVCLTCARRRVKCDKQKPRCGQCKYVNAVCKYAEPSAEESDKRHVDGADCEKTTEEYDEWKFMIDIGGDYKQYSVSSINWMTDLKQDKDIEIFVPAETKEMPQALAQRDIEIRNLLRKYLPIKEQVDQLIETYMYAIHPGLPIFERQYIAKEYALFWEVYEKGQPGTLGHFVCELFAMLYAAHITLDDQSKYDPETKWFTRPSKFSAQIQHYRRAVDLSLEIFQFLNRPSVRCFAAALIVQLMANRNAGIEMVIEAARLMRIAEILGLHRDPENFKSANLSYREKQFRRKLWWMVNQLDLLSSSSNGVPAITRPSQENVKLPEWHSTTEIEHVSYMINERHIILANFMRSLYQDVYEKSSTELLSGSLMEDMRSETLEKVEELKKLSYDHVEEQFLREYLEVLRDIGILSIQIQLSKTDLLYYKACHVIDSNNSEEWYRRHRDVVKAAITTIKFYLKIANDPKYLIFSWKLRMFNQFAATAELIRDIYRFPDDRINDPDERIYYAKEAINCAKRLNIGELSTSVSWQLTVLSNLADKVFKFIAEHSAKAAETALDENGLEVAKKGKVKDRQTSSGQSTEILETTVPDDDCEKYWSLPFVVQDQSEQFENIMNEFLNSSDWNADLSSYPFDTLDIVF